MIYCRAPPTDRVDDTGLEFPKIDRTAPNTVQRIGGTDLAVHCRLRGREGDEKVLSPGLSARRMPSAYIESGLAVDYWRLMKNAHPADLECDPLESRQGAAGYGNGLYQT